MWSPPWRSLWLSRRLLTLQSLLQSLRQSLLQSSLLRNLCRSHRSPRSPRPALERPPARKQKQAEATQDGARRRGRPSTGSRARAASRGSESGSRACPPRAPG